MLHDRRERDRSEDQQQLAREDREPPRRDVPVEQLHARPRVRYPAMYA